MLVGDRAVNNWHYQLTPTGSVTDVTESFRLNQNMLMSLYSVLGGQLRRRGNLRGMRKTLECIKAVVEGPGPTFDGEGARHLHEARLKQQRRTPGRKGHEPVP